MRRTTRWGPAVISFAAALSCGLYFALRTYEVDLGVYLRLGGRYIFTPNLYSLGLGHTGLLFTYPPFAALLFAPWQRVFTTVDAVQIGWTMCNLVALVALLVLSLRLVRPEWKRTSRWRLALVLMLPALLLNPVLLTVGFGQVNLVVTLLVLWDLLGSRRIGPFRVPMGVATGLAAAVKLTPIIFVPYLLLTRRFRAAITCLTTFMACGLVTFAISPASSRVYWTKALFDPARTATSVLTPGLGFISNQSLSGVAARLHHGDVSQLALMPVLLVVAGGGLWLASVAHRHSPMLGVLVCASTSLLVSPVTWSHHMVWIVPAILWLALASDRPRWGPFIAGAVAVLFWSAPIWWVPHAKLLELHLNAWQLLAGDSFFLAVVAFVGWVAFRFRRDLLPWRSDRPVQPTFGIVASPAASRSSVTSSSVIRPLR
jgi:alpha-1,2-mannosyltransferase